MAFRNLDLSLNKTTPAGEQLLRGTMNSNSSLQEILVGCAPVGRSVSDRRARNRAWSAGPKSPRKAQNDAVGFPAYLGLEDHQPGRAPPPDHGSTSWRAPSPGGRIMVRAPYADNQAVVNVSLASPDLHAPWRGTSPVPRNRSANGITMAPDDRTCSPPLCSMKAAASDMHSPASNAPRPEPTRLAWSEMASMASHASPWASNGASHRDIAVSSGGVVHAHTLGGHLSAGSPKDSLRAMEKRTSTDSLVRGHPSWHPGVRANPPRNPVWDGHEDVSNVTWGRSSSGASQGTVGENGGSSKSAKLAQSPSRSPGRSHIPSRSNLKAGATPTTVQGGSPGQTSSQGGSPRPDSINRRRSGCSAFP